MIRKTFTNALFTATVLAALIPCVTAYAHISVWPRESMAGGIEKYTLRVPTEGKIPTTSVELDVPEGVVFEAVEMSGTWKHEFKRQGDKIIGVVWHVNIPPAELVELSFIVRNPGAAAKQIVWPMRQKFSDGHTEEMTKGADGNIRVPATVKLNPRPAQ